MSDARPISEIFAEVIARTEEMMGIQGLIRSIETDAERKAYILDLYQQELIDGEDAYLLIEAHGLESA